jgi:hypothetical protein
MTQLRLCHSDSQMAKRFAFGCTRLDKKGKDGVTAVAVTFEALPRASLEHLVYVTSAEVSFERHCCNYKAQLPCYASYQDRRIKCRSQLITEHVAVYGPFTSVRARSGRSKDPTGTCAHGNL